MGNPLPSFFCPITDNLMRDSVCTADGHTYKRVAIERWLARHETSPSTKIQLLNKNLTPNRALRKSIEAWQETHGMHLRRAGIEMGADPLPQGHSRLCTKDHFACMCREVPQRLSLLLC